jgi:hypothetical protein
MLRSILSASVVVSVALVAMATVQPSAHVGYDERAGTSGCVVHVALRWEAETLRARGRQQVQTEASAIWKQLGVDLRWSLEAIDRVRVSVSIVVTDQVEQTGAEEPIARLGFVEFTGSDPSNVLFVSAAAAMAAVSDSRGQLSILAEKPPEFLTTIALRLLGRAVAHELGHYLLGARGHAPYGLMRPRFRVFEAMLPGLGGYGLTAEHARLLRRRLGSLTTSAAPPGSRGCYDIRTAS